MTNNDSTDTPPAEPQSRAEKIVEFRRQETLLKTGALQDAIFNSAYFSSIATDEKGVIQIFNVGAERMLGYQAADVVNLITPADISDPKELITRAAALSLELDTPITPGFEALVFKASRGIEDIYELTYIRKDGSRLSAMVSVTSLRDSAEIIIGYLLIGTDNTARKQEEATQALLDQRLRDQQFYTRSLIESNIDALMMTDPQGIISDVNKQMMALTGRTRDELIGAPCKNFFTDPARAEAAIKRVLSENKVSDYELTVRAYNGDETVVSYNAATFHDPIELFVPQGLDDISVTACTPGFFRVFFHGHGGQCNDRYGGGVDILLEDGSCRQPVHSGQLDIHQDQLRLAFTCQRQPSFRVCGTEHTMARLSQQQAREAHIGSVIFDDQDLGHGASTAVERRIGNHTTNRAPAPSRLATATLPPCNSTNCLTIASPRPVPSNLRARLLSIWLNALNSLFMLSFAMPIPVSLTLNSRNCRYSLSASLNP